mmetsp:Transcript_36578/g.113170  ORF Transcript_36578/g.113170 Transcript_36578/m.113170 type:complete len:86 (+) Transcript_36578:1864-2121(+)
MPRIPCCVTGRSDTFSAVPRATPWAAVVPIDEVKFPLVPIICLGTAPDAGRIPAEVYILTLDDVYLKSGQAPTLSSTLSRLGNNP